MRITLMVSSLLLVLSACSSVNQGSNPEELVRTRASFDFNCESSALKVENAQGQRYLAKGCGTESLYELHCSLGPCQAQAVSK